MKELRELIHNAELTKTQTLIAQFILDNPSDACFMTSTEISLALGVSESSVIRFSRSLGFSGFMEFQKYLRATYQKKILSISSSITVPAQRVAQQVELGSYSEYIEQHFQNAVNNLQVVFQQNTADTFAAAADAIISSKRRYVAATRSNTCLADYFLLYLKQMLPRVVMTNTTSASPIDHMCSIGPEDCFILFSFPRYSSVDRITTQMAKDAGATIILVTDKPSALLAQYADVLLTVPVDSNAFFNSMVAAQFVIEALLDAISHKVDGIEDRLRVIDKYLDELGNY